MNLVQVLPKGRFGAMISFEFHLKNQHEKTQKPLWFLGFQPRYLFRCYLLAKNAYFDTMHPLIEQEVHFCFVGKLSFPIENWKGCKLK